MTPDGVCHKIGYWCECGRSVMWWC